MENRPAVQRPRIPHGIGLEARCENAQDSNAPMKRSRGATTLLRVGATVVLALASAAMVHASELGAVHTIAGGPYEASGAVQSPDGKGILFVDDNRPDVVFWMKLRTDESLAAPPISVPIGVQVSDPEGITADGTYVYVVGSQSRGPRRAGADLVRFRFDGARGRAKGAEVAEDLGALLGDKVVAGGKGGKKSELNIEGLAWDAKGTRLLLGLRAPLDDSGRALVLPLKLRNPRKALTSSNLEVGAPIPVDLGGAGIRALEADGTGGFWIIAGGVTEAGTSRLVRWSGSSSAVQVVATLPADLKPEGVAPIRVGNRRFTVVFSDTSHYLVLEPLTIAHGME